MTEEKYGDSYGEKFRKYEDKIADLEKQLTEKDKQIEKMKNCDNCCNLGKYCSECKHHNVLAKADFWELEE